MKDPVSEELDGNSQVYLCLRDICHYIDNTVELDLYNKVLLVISDMGFDGIGDVIAQNRPLKDESREEIDFEKMKEVCLLRLLLGLYWDRLYRFRGKHSSSTVY